MSEKDKNNLYPYLTDLYLENVRCFGERQHLEFKDKEGKPARWTVILGENGTGKTTVLRAIAYMFYEAKMSIYPSAPVPTDKNKPSFYPLHNFRRHPEQHFTIETFFNRANDLNAIVLEPPLKGQLELGPNEKEERIGKDYVFKIKPWFHGKPNSYLSFTHIFGYGASRQSGQRGSAITHAQSDDSLKSLFDENSPLINPEEWLVQEDYLVKSSKRPKIKLEEIKNLLLNLFEGEIHDILIEPEENSPMVRFQTNYGWVGLHDLSLGYKTLIAWVVDMGRRMFDIHSKLENPLAGPAIALVDEIDLHMHPKLQRNLFDFLSSKFPNTQFIVTAHSPLVVLSSKETNLIVLKREGEQVVVDNDPAYISTWRVDQLLSSDIFGGVSSRSPEVEKLFKERRQLLSKKKPSLSELKRIEEIEKEIDIIPVSEDPTIIEAMNFLKEEAQEYKSKNK